MLAVSNKKQSCLLREIVNVDGMNDWMIQLIMLYNDYNIYKAIKAEQVPMNRYLASYEIAWKGLSGYRTIIISNWLLLINAN